MRVRLPNFGLERAYQAVDLSGPLLHGARLADLARRLEMTRLFEKIVVAMAGTQVQRSCSQEARLAAVESSGTPWAFILRGHASA